MHRLTVGAVSMCLLFIIVGIGTAAADSAIRNFNIPEEDLGSALRDFGRQSNQEILFSTEIVQGKKTAGLKGAFTVEAAIAALLAGTDLVVTKTADGSLLVSHRDKGASNLSSGSSSEAPVASAQGAEEPRADGIPGLEEIIVTATRRAISVQRIEGGIVPLTQGLVRDTGAQTLADLAGAAPGLSFGEMSSTEQVFTIRGVNTSSQVSDQQSPTALYFDEVPVSDPYLSMLTPSFQLFDVSRVEVLLGPQGTLFGAGALGGAVRVVSNKPLFGKFDTDVEQTVAFPSVGNPAYATNAMLNLPLNGDTVALRLVGTYLDEGGYIDNAGLGQRNYNSLHAATARAELKWQATANLAVTATYAYESDRPNASPYTFYGSRDYTYTSALANRSAEVLNIANLVLEYTGDAFTATSSTSYLRRNPTQQADLTALASQVTGVNSPANDLIGGYTRNLIQEFRVASPNQQAFRWLGGVYLQKYDINETEISNQRGAGAALASIGYPTDNLLDDVYTGYVNEQALYGELSYDLNPQVSATLGARGFHDSVAITDTYGGGYLDGGPGALHNGASYSGLTPKFVLSYKPDAERMYYAQASEGFRSGQGNLNNGTDPISGTPIGRFYGPDRLWNFELGAKTTLYGRTTLNGDVYDIDWRSIQLQQRSPAGINYTANAGRAWIRGVDLQVTSELTDRLDVGLNLDYHRSRLTQVNAGVNAVVGDELPGSSRFSSYAYGKYKFNLGAVQGFLRFDYIYASKAFSDLDNATSLHYGNVGSVGAQLGAHFRNYEVLLFGRNLGDARNRVNAFELLGVPTQVLQSPRTVGLTFRWNYRGAHP